MGTTSTQVKARWNAKHYKQFAAQIKPELFERLEKARAQAGMSRSEFLVWAIDTWEKQGQ